ncbi:Thioredoxin [Humidesulfovibrio mexicanus]|uniref:Thioredoxin n=1 Tax=Humidesulfovibrio mexicanus TaxID=147047 RepID=A0A239B2K8_9BACT|nr:thioredoxin domain-containing protein [Humidesulfovibrio mexicanus]SNS01812.1 Thioredoxin [Humidesulfovibrio mexicanus]
MRRISFRLASVSLALGLLLSGLCAEAMAAAHARKNQAAAKPTPAAEEKAQPAAQGLDVEAFRRNFVAGLAGRRNAPALSPDNVRILSTEKAVPFAGTDIYAVRGELIPADGQAQPFTLFVSADGRFYVSDIIDLGAGKSILKPARDKMLAEDLAQLGHVIAKGTGQRTVVYVSDPFCPYCRMAFAFLMEKPQAFAELRLAHFPLSSHSGADIACALMAWAVDKAPDKAADFAKFAYSDLAAPRPADKSEASRKKAWVEVANAFLKRFPELKALGENGEAIVNALSGSSWGAAVQADMARAAALDVTGTPVVFVDGARVEGFDQKRLGALLQ